MTEYSLNTVYSCKSRTGNCQSHREVATARNYLRMLLISCNHMTADNVTNDVHKPDSQQLSNKTRHKSTANRQRHTTSL